MTNFRMTRAPASAIDHRDTGSRCKYPVFLFRALGGCCGAGDDPSDDRRGPCGRHGDAPRDIRDQAARGVSRPLSTGSLRARLGSASGVSEGVRDVVNPLMLWLCVRRVEPGRDECGEPGVRAICGDHPTLKMAVWAISVFTVSPTT